MKDNRNENLDHTDNEQEEYANQQVRKEMPPHIKNLFTIWDAVSKVNKEREDTQQQKAELALSDLQVAEISVLTDMGVDTEFYIKWAEQELKSQFLQTDKELQKGFTDMLTTGREIWKFRGEGSTPERIVSGTPEWYENLDKIQKLQEGEKEKQQLDTRYLDNLMWECPIQDQVPVEIAIEHDLQGVKLSVEDTVYLSLEELVKDMTEAINIPNTTLKVVNMQICRDKLQRTIQTGVYIQTNPMV